jgi:hypothetical protein
MTFVSGMEGEFMLLSMTSQRYIHLRRIVKSSDSHPEQTGENIKGQVSTSPREQHCCGLESALLGRGTCGRVE